MQPLLAPSVQADGDYSNRASEGQQRTAHAKFVYSLRRRAAVSAAPSVRVSFYLLLPSASCAQCTTLKLVDASTVKTCVAPIRVCHMTSCIATQDFARRFTNVPNSSRLRTHGLVNHCHLAQRETCVH